MKSGHSIQWTVLFALAAGALLTFLSACGSEPTTEKPLQASATLVNTHWKLGQLGDRVIATPQGAREVYFTLQPDQRVAGFSGCNRMMGGYALNGSQLRFDQMAGTKMACPGTAMQIEDEFLAIFPRVSRWEISGQTLRLLDTDGKTIAAFQARPPDQKGTQPD